MERRWIVQDATSVKRDRKRPPSWWRRKLSRIGETIVMGAVSLISVVMGAALAYSAGRFPAHVESLETGAGVLLIGGLALLGVALPTFL
jgi:hypothetical protein